METNEIMTGDYFRIAQTGKIIKIEAVDELSGSVDYFDGDAGGVLTIGVEKIEPIPITAEILNKNGFEPRKLDGGNYYYIADDYFDITIDEWSDGNWRIRYDCTEMSIPHSQILCSYVHEKQNFMRLCGLNELADNFKV